MFTYEIICPRKIFRVIYLSYRPGLLFVFSCSNYSGFGLWELFYLTHGFLQLPLFLSLISSFAQSNSMGTSFLFYALVIELTFFFFWKALFLFNPRNGVRNEYLNLGVFIAVAFLRKYPIYPYLYTFIYVTVHKYIKWCVSLLMSLTLTYGQPTLFNSVVLYGETARQGKAGYTVPLLELMRLYTEYS